jgi:hypothetical protein
LIRQYFFCLLITFQPPGTSTYLKLQPKPSLLVAIHSTDHTILITSMLGVSVPSF